ESLPLLDPPPALLSAGEKRTDHRGTRTGGQCLGQVARELDATIGNDADAHLVRDFHGRHDRRQLWDTNAGHDTGRADRSRTNTDLHRVRTRTHQRASAFTGRNVARENAHRIETG